MLKWQLNVRGFKKRERGINITLLCEYIAEIDVNFGESNIQGGHNMVGKCFEGNFLLDFN